MQENWYIVYTKPGCEKKVGSLLSKRNIENFCPLNKKVVKRLRKNREITEPLFNSYIFIKIYKSKLHEIMKIKGIISVVYFKGEPAIIKNEEVCLIKEFTSNFFDIKLEKIKINYSTFLKCEDENNYSFDGKVIIIKKRIFKVQLPSMGYTLVANISNEIGIDEKLNYQNNGFKFQYQ